MGGLLVVGLVTEVEQSNLDDGTKMLTIYVLIGREVLSVYCVGKAQPAETPAEGQFWACKARIRAKGGQESAARLSTVFAGDVDAGEVEKLRELL